MEIMLILGLSGLCYIYAGYQLILKMAVRLSSKCLDVMLPYTDKPSVTVLVTVHNEAHQIEEKIQNILSCNYPENKLEVMVASDGSTDKTDEIVDSLPHLNVRLFRPQNRHGKTDTENKAITMACGEIIVFTDADTRHDPEFLNQITSPFANSQVGAVDGRLIFLSETDSNINQSQGLYWSQELKIRKHESCLGILAVASGACMAMRKSLFKPMVEEVGEDCQIPLMVVSQGYRLIHADKAISWDRMPADPIGEFRARVRMTLRNWHGTWLYPELLNPFRYPAIAWALWSHKILRWLSPFFLILWLAGSLGYLVQGGIWPWLAWPALIFIVMAAIGTVVHKGNMRVPLAGTAFSFMLANTGFLLGVCKALAGRHIKIYKS